MSRFLVLYTTYDVILIGLFSGSELIDHKREEKHHASSRLLVAIDELLHTHGLTLTSLACIGAVCGPAPFTSLRTVLTTLNGIACAAHTKLVALDGIALLLAQYGSKQLPTVVLMNAFNKEMYYGFYEPQGQLITGYARYETIQKLVAETFPDQVIEYMGNGVSLCREELMSQGPLAYIPQELPIENSLAFLGAHVARHLESGEALFVPQLFPMYLKSIL
jgi:tRNA threonylcarbamoyl adenosine modification protein YeaZ